MPISTHFVDKIPVVSMGFLFSFNSSGVFTCFYEISLFSASLFQPAGDLGTQILPSRTNWNRVASFLPLIVMVKLHKGCGSESSFAAGTVE